jgi:hypothetical protein
VNALPEDDGTVQHEARPEQYQATNSRIAWSVSADAMDFSTTTREFASISVGSDCDRV